jgi:hypothetical protein
MEAAYAQSRITFSRPDGTQGSITVSPAHSVYRLVAPVRAEAATAASVDARECRAAPATSTVAVFVSLQPWRNCAGAASAPPRAA